MRRAEKSAWEFLSQYAFIFIDICFVKNFVKFADASRQFSENSGFLCLIKRYSYRVFALYETFYGVFEFYQFFRVQPDLTRVLDKYLICQILGKFRIFSFLFECIENPMKLKDK